MELGSILAVALLPILIIALVSKDKEKATDIFLPMFLLLMVLALLWAVGTGSG